jgi:hypothetical protein
MRSSLNAARSASWPGNRTALIAYFAHRFWREEGRPQGRALDHWLKAELIVDARESLPRVVVLHRR